MNRLLPSNPESLTGEGPLPHPPPPSLLSLDEQSMSAPTDSTSLSNSLNYLLASNKNDSNSFLDSDADTTMSPIASVTMLEQPPKAAPSSSPPSSSSPESNQTSLFSSSPPIKTEMSIDPRPPRRRPFICYSFFSAQNSLFRLESLTNSSSSSLPIRPSS